MKLALRVTLVIVVLCISSLSAMAQEGGIVVRGNAGADPTAFAPLLTNETVTSDIQALIFPDLLSVDPSTASIVNGPGPNALATGWELSEDGLTYTFSLREDMYWTDGEQINADDVMFVWDFIQSGAVPTHLSFVADEIANVERIDDFTIAVSFAEADCDAINSIGSLEPYPSHIAPEDLTTMPDQEFNQNLNESSGPNSFGEVRPAESISLLANPDYVDAELGYVNNDAFVLLNVPDLTVMVERFLAGELSIISGPQEARRAE
ncbi:MAG: hypothetical protein J4G17_12520, partial [Anaerolineae bacterium]|nr:hypothetical protein [Anaerolineae bacterium]